MEETDNKPEDKSAEEGASSPEATTQGSVEEAPSETGGTTPATVSMEQRTFPGEVPMTFQETWERIPRKEHRGASILTLLLQPILGALPNQVKKDLEATVGNRIVFSAAAATGLNIMLNLFGYPVLLMLVAIGLHGVDVVFSQKINGFIL
ncbi:MAG: hypothetical protein IH796_08795, partial [Deltaproteobacteria bacterium]|nr:hypothetical protein [Deltaproteobacteria bacterium]